MTTTIEQMASDWECIYKVRVFLDYDPELCFTRIIMIRGLKTVECSYPAKPDECIKLEDIKPVFISTIEQFKRRRSDQNKRSN